MVAPDMPLALRVAKREGEVARSKVRALGLLDSRRKILDVQGYLEIPLMADDQALASLGSLVEQKHAVWAGSPLTPYQLIYRKAPLPEDLKLLLPRRWEKIGDVLALRFPPALRPYQSEVCQTYAAILGVRAIVDIQAIEGPWRRPRAELLWGDDTETIHTENGIRYKLDVRNVMFSSGNIDERVRMSKVCLPGEVVVDMFAGIGYFSLPMAIHGGAAIVYACEVNPIAYHYLKENIRINEADCVRPLFGDCREVAPHGVADRVLLGYLRDTYLFLPEALRALRSEGWIHLHEACPDDTASKLAIHLREAVKAQDMKLSKSHLRRVKSYAPCVSHWVLDAFIAQAGPLRSRSR
ncbi:MAG: class I SAM-dependent methyltransferase family protein [Thermoplasmata archaeon]